MCASGWVCLSVCIGLCLCVCASGWAVFEHVLVLWAWTVDFQTKTQFQASEFRIHQKSIHFFFFSLIDNGTFYFDINEESTIWLCGIALRSLFQSDSLNKQTNERTTERTSAQAFVCRSSAAFVFVIVCISWSMDVIRCALLCFIAYLTNKDQTQAHTHTLTRKYL